MPNFQCIATFPKRLITSSNYLLPPIYTIGEKLITAFPPFEVMSDKTTNILIDFNKCAQNIAYNFINWGSRLLNVCPDYSKHYIDKVIREKNKISFVFEKPFEISSNGTISFWETSYDVIEDIIKEGSIAVFKGFNTTSDCAADHLKTTLFPDSEVILRLVGMSGGFGQSITNEDDSNGLNMLSGDPAVTSGLASISTQTVIIVGGVLSSICAILKMREYYRNWKKKTYDVNISVYTMESTEFVIYQENTYQYDDNTNTWVNCTGVDLAYHA